MLTIKHVQQRPLTTGETLVSASGMAISMFAQIPLVGLHSVLSGFVGSLASNIQDDNAEAKSLVDTRSASKTDVDRLLENIYDSGDFPDEDLADKIEKASKDFRKNFRLRSR